jgi:hypothetical protein
MPTIGVVTWSDAGVDAGLKVGLVVEVVVGVALKVVLEPVVTGAAEVVLESVLAVANGNEVSFDGNCKPESDAKLGLKSDLKLELKSNRFKISNATKSLRVLLASTMA